MLSNKDINFDDDSQILTINGEAHAVGNPEISGEIDALDERVTALETIPGEIEALDVRVTALEEAGGGGVGAWTLLADVDAADNSYTYIRKLAYKDKNIFAEDTEANEILVLLHSNSSTYFAPPIIFPVSVMKQNKPPMYRSIDAWESTKKGFIATRDSAYTDSITTYQYNNGSNVKVSVYVR